MPAAKEKLLKPCLLLKSTQGTDRNGIYTLFELFSAYRGQQHMKLLAQFCCIGPPQCNRLQRATLSIVCKELPFKFCCCQG
eukprot:33690-Pelagomonas_calceolata.AAC.3